MTASERAGAPADDRSPNPADEQLRGKAYTESVSEVTPYGLMFDRPLSTTRTCGGPTCWCHIGRIAPSTTSSGFYWDHRAYMDSMANRIRYLEVREGVVA
jgi:hypothetical protein